MAIDSPSRNKSYQSRLRDYQDATRKVGGTEIDRLERVMKDKLFQRSYETSSPFQVRKAFKFFDRERSMRISIEGFTQALEFLGFQFSELQNLALFARYDPECVGTIDYMNFISSAMFYAAVEPTFAHYSKGSEGEGPRTANNAGSGADREQRLLQEAEVRRIFNKIDDRKTGSIDAADLELMLMSMGVHLTAKEVDSCLRDLGVKSGDKIPFQLFFEWWTESSGRWGKK